MYARVGRREKCEAPLFRRRKKWSAENVNRYVCYEKSTDFVRIVATCVRRECTTNGALGLIFVNCVVISIAT